MKVLFDIPDNKAASMMEVLRSISFIKVKTLSDEKAQLIGEIREAVENIKLVRQGKLKARLAKELLDGL